MSGRIEQEQFLPALAARLLVRVGELVDDPYVMGNTPASVGLLASRAFDLHERGFGRDPSEEQTEDGALFPPTAAAVVVNVYIDGKVVADELPPEGEVEPESDGA